MKNAYTIASKFLQQCVSVHLEFEFREKGSRRLKHFQKIRGGIFKTLNLVKD